MIETIEVLTTEPYPDRAYEWVFGRAHYAVDPADPGTSRVADLSLLPTDRDGKIRFEGDIAIVRPTRGGNGRAVVSVVNRGTAWPPLSGPGIAPTPAKSRLDPGDGYLLDHGWTLALPGWQWDVPANGLGLQAPVLTVEPGWLRTDFQVSAPTFEKVLGDGLPGPITSASSLFSSYPATDPDDQDAVLRVRLAQMGPSHVVPRSHWRFTSPTTVALEGEFQPARWYELMYRSTFAPVVGCGLLALRDAGSWLRHGAEFVFAHGVSQSGRALRQLLFEGLNLDEDGGQVFDGVFAEIASARRGEFNRRYAQPGLLAPMMPEYGPPYDTSSLLARQRERGGIPKIIFANSAWEYWRGDGALVHQDPVTGDDLPEDPDARVHLLSGTDHLGSSPAAKQFFPAANRVHNLDPSPVNRALFAQLVEWVVDAVEPSPSTVPRRADGTAVSREEALLAFPDAQRPDPAHLPYTPEIDPENVTWPLPTGAPRVALVSALDAYGNEAAGIRLPAVEAAVAVYSGWNPRRHIEGLPDVLCDLIGSRVERAPGSAPVTRRALRVCAERLVARRFLLPEDLESAVDAAMAELDGSGGAAHDEAAHQLGR